MGIEDRTPPTPEEYAAYPERFSNWGRWGEDDELGTLNHVTPEARCAAAASVSEGRVVSMARRVDTEPGPHNPHPAIHVASVGAATGLADYLGLFFHGFSQTHLDALSHLPSADGRYYNGLAIGLQSPALAMPEGVALGIQRMRQGVVARGVLYDIPRLRGRDFVDSGAPVHGWELADAAKAQGIEPSPGDVVCIRSGRDEWQAAHPDFAGWGVRAGVHASACEFLYETDAAMLCWDMLDAPTEDQGLANPMEIEAPVHVHAIAIPYMGMPLLDNADFRDLSVTCAELGRWSFLLCVAPLVIEGGTGSPVNPLAIF
jgi:kynurenine formamidase